jgi:hypothetical protein
LNIDFGINNEKQDYRIDTVCVGVLLGAGRKKNEVICRTAVTVLIGNLVNLLCPWHSTNKLMLQIFFFDNY